MNEIDFTTALGRLLSDAALRAAFRLDATGVTARLRVCAEDRLALLRLSPDQLDAQAGVLFRKRFEGLRQLLPVTCTRLGNELWGCCADFAAQRGRGPSTSTARSDAAGRGTPIQLALDFALHLVQRRPEALCRSEVNRLRFVVGRTPLRLHLVNDLHVEGHQMTALQIFLRWSGHWWETAVCFSAKPLPKPLHPVAPEDESH